MADIHDRMPVILAPADYARWLGEEPDPRDLMRPSPPTDADVADFDTGQQARERRPSIVEPIERGDRMPRS